MRNFFAKLMNLLTKNWVKLLIIITVISFGFLTQETVRSLDNPRSCNLCHSMQPYNNSWHTSSHNAINCTFCHNDYPISVPKTDTITVKKYLLTTNKVVRVFGKSVDYLAEKIPVADVYLKNKATVLRMYYNMYQGKTVSPWKNCAICHQDLLAAKGPDHYGHYKHMENGQAECKRCHDGLVHGKPAQASWMDCSLCHSTPPKPASHQSIDFDITHGQDYKNQKTCTLCHPGGINQKLCLDCHKIKLPHVPEYKTIHIQEISKVGISNCMNCHKQQAPEDKPASTACESCHGKKMPHDKNILQTHPNLAKKEGVKMCSYCHQTSPAQQDMAPSCISCHKVEMPHPQNWMSAHPSSVYATGKDACIFCHSPSNPVNPRGPTSTLNFCSNCHTTKVLHSANWRLDHQQEVDVLKNSDKCFLCHSLDYKQGHCIYCHEG